MADAEKTIRFKLEDLLDSHGRIQKNWFKNYQMMN